MRPVHIRHLGRVPYERSYRDMQAFNAGRDSASMDEIWTLEHEPVYTLGLAGRREHILDAGGIPVLATDRGGQVTYHGPGQLVVYPLLDLKRSGLGIRDYVRRLEQSVIDMLADLDITANRRERAPGVYTGDGKIAALGVRVRRGCCYHGLALNVAMDLAPFGGIHPCGYAGLEVTQVSDYGISMTTAEAAQHLLPRLLQQLGLQPAAGVAGAAADGPQPLTM